MPNKNKLVLDLSDNALKKVHKEIREEYKEIYCNTYSELKTSIDIFIILYGTESLEKLLNEIFKERKIKRIAIKNNYRLNKKFGINPIKID